MKIPFSPPHIDDAIIDEVVATLRSGWITTGPRTKLFEQRLAEYCGIQRVVCVNSASAGLELVLHWFGIGQGDEVIIPAYTYTATAAVVLHCGAKPVMVDVNDELLMDVEQLGNAITSRTKAIIPVDIVGLPCNYDRLMDFVQQPSVRQKFQPNNPILFTTDTLSCSGWTRFVATLTRRASSRASRRARRRGCRPGGQS